MAKRFRKHKPFNPNHPDYTTKVTDKKIGIDSRVENRWDGWIHTITVSPLGSFAVIDSYTYKLQNKTTKGQRNEIKRNLDKIVSKYERQGYDIRVR